MREIKFRAWEQSIEYMHEGSKYFHMSLDDIGSLDHPDLDYMQFAGLTDKNGVEIYEGDIVNYWSLFQCHSDAVDYFGVEAQNNYPVSEVYLEVKTGAVEFTGGQFSVKNKNIFSIGRDVVGDLMDCAYQDQLGMELKDFVYDFHEDGFKSPMRKQLGELEVIGNIHENPELLK